MTEKHLLFHLMGDPSCIVMKWVLEDQPYFTLGCWVCVFLIISPRLHPLYLWLPGAGVPRHERSSAGVNCDLTRAHTHKHKHKQTTGRLGEVMKVDLLFRQLFQLLVSSCQLKVEVSANGDNRWNSFHAVKCAHDCKCVFVFPPQDKRRIQENIATKRRQIEEEKLKLQYIKVIFTVITEN